MRQRHVFAALLAVWAVGCDDGGGGGSPSATLDAGGDGMSPDATPGTPDAALDAALADAAGPDPDAAPEGPRPPVVGDPVIATPEALLAEPALAVAVAQTLIVVGSEAGLTLLGDGEPWALEAEAGDLRAAALIDAGLVVAAGGALWVLGEEGLARSPISDLLSDIEDLVAIEDTLWIAAADGLFRWSEGVLEPIRPDGLPAVGVQLASSPEGLYVAGEEAVYRLEGAPLQAQPTAGAAGGRVAVDADGSAWMAARGSLWWLDDDAWWWPVALPFVAEQVAAGAGATGVWIAGEDLWHLDEGTLRRYDGAPAPELLRADADGAAVIAGPAGVHRVPLGRLVQIDDLPDEILRAHEVRVRPSLPDRVARVAVTLDGAPLETEGVDPWRVTLDPFALDRGTHSLAVEVVWDDEATASAEAEFASKVVTWTEDIHPLAVRRCAMCHGQGAAARELWTAAQWRPIIEQILDATRTGRMPLGQDRVPADELELIDAWREADMPEDWP